MSAINPQGGTGMADPTKSQLDFLWKVHDYTNNYIRFSDTKAALVVAFSSGFIASLVTHDLHHPLRVARVGGPVSWGATWTTLTVLAAFSLLISAVFVAIASIMPRLRPLPPQQRNLPGRLASVRRWVKELFASPADTPRAPIFWGSVLSHGTQEEYAKAIQTLTLEHQVRAVADHLFVIAGISDRKFRLVNLSLVLAILGGTIAGLLIAFASKS